VSLFPDNPGLALDPYEWTPRFKTMVAGPFDNENIVTRAVLQFTLHACTIHYFYTGWTALAEAVYEFFVSMKGRYGSFAFYDLQGWDASPIGILWKGQYVGVGNASTLIFDVPAYIAINDANRKIYCGGVDKTSTGSWATGTGADGRDRFTFSTYTPALGEVITCNFLGRRVWKAAFASDTPSTTLPALKWHPADIYEFQVDLVEIP
jgi:hypothetical protein